MLEGVREYSLPDAKPFKVFDSAEAGGFRGSVNSGRTGEFARLAKTFQFIFQKVKGCDLPQKNKQEGTEGTEKKLCFLCLLLFEFFA